MIKQNIFIALLLTCYFLKSAEYHSRLALMEHVEREKLCRYIGIPIYELGGIPKCEMEKIRKDADGKLPLATSFSSNPKPEKLNQYQGRYIFELGGIPEREMEKLRKEVDEQRKAREEDSLREEQDSKKAILVLLTSKNPGIPREIPFHNFTHSQLVDRLFADYESEGRQLSSQLLIHLLGGLGSLRDQILRQDEEQRTEENSILHHPIESRIEVVEQVNFQQEMPPRKQQLKLRRQQQQYRNNNNRIDRPKHAQFTMRINQPKSKGKRRG